MVDDSLRVGGRVHAVVMLRIHGNTPPIHRLTSRLNAAAIANSFASTIKDAVETSAPRAKDVRAEQAEKDQTG